MKLVYILGLLLSTTALAGNGSGNVSAVANFANNATVPGLVAPIAATPTNIFSLYAGKASITSGNFQPFIKDGVLYQVTTGKKAYCFSIIGMSAAGGAHIQLVSSTASIALNTNTALTSPKYQCGAAATYCMPIPSAGIGTQIGGMYIFDALSYPAYQSDSSDVKMVMTCYEN